MTSDIFPQQSHENLRSQTCPCLGLNLLSVHISASCPVIDFLNFRNFMTILYLQHFGFISLFWGHEIIFFSRVTCLLNSIIGNQFSAWRVLTFKRKRVKCATGKTPSGGHVSAAPGCVQWAIFRELFRGVVQCFSTN